MERGKQFLFILFLAVLLAGCGWKNLDSKKEETLEFTVVEEEDLPGYSVQVRKLAATEDAIYFSTELLGPQTEEEQRGGVSCPYLAVKIPSRDLPVVFE